YHREDGGEGTVDEAEDERLFSLDQYPVQVAQHRDVRFGKTPDNATIGREVALQVFHLSRELQSLDPACQIYLGEPAQHVIIEHVHWQLNFLGDCFRCIPRITAVGEEHDRSRNAGVGFEPGEAAAEQCAHRI